MANATRITGHESIANDRTEIITNANSIIRVTRRHLALGALALAFGVAGSALAGGSEETPFSAHESASQPR
jgi:hypothetical protein